MNIWEAAIEYKQLVDQIKTAHHPHLALASIWVLASDSKAIVDNRLVATETRRCTKTEKLKTGHDFKITIRAEAWNVLTEQQRKIAIDEALCKCGVRYVPEIIEINKKKEVVTDEIGRIIYTDQIATDGEGNPKWKINQLDAGVYFALLTRYSIYNEEVDNIQRALAGQPLKRPMATKQQDYDPGVEEDEEAAEEAGETDAGLEAGDPALPETPPDQTGPDSQ